MPMTSKDSSKNIKEFHTGKTYQRTKAKFGKKRADAQAIAAGLNAARRAGASIPPPMKP